MTHSIYETLALNIPALNEYLAPSPPPEDSIASVQVRLDRDGGVDFGEKLTSLKIKEMVMLK